MPKQPKLAVLVSGTGSNLHAIIGKLDVRCIIADRICPAITDIASTARIPNLTIKRRFDQCFDHTELTCKVLDTLKFFDIEVVAMAGFMTILSSFIFKAYPNRILNIHPSLLPDFKGAHAVCDALASGRKITGCTVHIATEQLDAGTILAQQQVPILEGDTIETLHERIKIAERQLYPKTIAQFFEEYL